MAGKTYRVRIARGDQQFEAEGDKSFVLEMVKRFEIGSTSGPSKPRLAEITAPDPATLASSKAVSVGEFIRQFGFKRHTDLVLAFGYYLEQHSGVKEFTPADINNCYYEAKMEPSNTSQAIILNIKRGLLMVAKVDKKNAKGGSKKYTLTSSGENHLKRVATKSAEEK
jgi:hypothetical protein